MLLVSCSIGLSQIGDIMAKVTDPLRSTEARGKVGGTQYNTWRGLRTTRTNVGPGGYNNAPQTAVRTITKGNTAQWKLLTDAQRARWNHYALTHPQSDWTGHPLRLSGYNWYIRCNYWRVFLSLSRLSVPPTAPGPPAPGNLACVRSGTDAYFTWSAIPGRSHTNDRLLIYRVGPHSAGRNIFLQLAKYLEGVNYTNYSRYSPIPSSGRWSYWVYNLDRATGLKAVPQKFVIDRP